MKKIIKLEEFIINALIELNQHDLTTEIYKDQINMYIYTVYKILEKQGYELEIRQPEKSLEETFSKYNNLIKIIEFEGKQGFKLNCDGLLNNNDIIQLRTNLEIVKLNFSESLSNSNIETFENIILLSNEEALNKGLGIRNYIDQKVEVIELKNKEDTIIIKQNKDKLFMSLTPNKNILIGTPTNIDNTDFYSTSIYLSKSSTPDTEDVTVFTDETKRSYNRTTLQNIGEFTKLSFVGTKRENSSVTYTKISINNENYPIYREIYNSLSEKAKTFQKIGENNE